jgi:hypothetical protein
VIDNYSGQYTDIFTVSAAPEQPTWAMVLFGFCGVGFLLYCRKSEPAPLLDRHGIEFLEAAIGRSFVSDQETKFLLR